MKILLPLLIIGLAWMQELIDQFAFNGLWNLEQGAGLPWWRVFTSPFSHSNFNHLFSNTLVFLPASWIALSKSLRDYLKIWLGVLLLQIPLAIFMPVSSHGLSGVVYGLLGYLMLIGLLEKKFYTILISIVSIYLYGNHLFSLIPMFSPKGISWTAHISGFIAGMAVAISIYKEN